MRVLPMIKHYRTDMPLPPWWNSASGLLVTPNVVDAGILSQVDSASLEEPGIIACHMGGLRWANPWDGPALFDGTMVARTNDGSPVYHFGYGPDYRLLDFPSDPGHHGAEIAQYRADQWRTRLGSPKYRQVTHVFNDEYSPWTMGLGIGWETAIGRMRPEAPDWVRPSSPIDFDRWSTTMLAKCRAALGAPIVSNCDAYAPYCDVGGGCMEGAFHWSGASDSMPFPPALWWYQHEKLASWTDWHLNGTCVSGIPIMVLSETKGDGYWRGVLRFVLASILVSAPRHGTVLLDFVVRRANDGLPSLHAEYDVLRKLGEPVGDAQQISTPRTGQATAYRRAFENGTVVVNPSGVDMTSPAFNAVGYMWGDTTQGGGVQRLRAGCGMVVLRC